MKKRAWLSLGLVVLIALTGVLGSLLMTTRQPLPDYHLMLDAARRMERGLAAIREEKTRLGIPVNPEEDRHLSGVIGAASSPITTTLGPLAAKRSSALPDTAALCARLLREAGLQSGERVGAVLSGSFPGLNLALLSACDALDLKCVYTVSLGSSTYGANQPALSAPEMLLLLYDKGLIASPPALITPGGQEDSGQNMMGWAFPEEARDILALYERMGLTRPRDYEEAVALRRSALGRIDCFVSVGGHDAALGPSDSPLWTARGLIKSPGTFTSGEEGLGAYYLARGIPVISLLNLRGLFEDYGLPYDPPVLPENGQSPVYFQVRRPGWPAILALSLCLVLLLAWRHQARRSDPKEKESMHRIFYLLGRAREAKDKQRRVTLLLQALAMLEKEKQEAVKASLGESARPLLALRDALHEQDADSGAGFVSQGALDAVPEETLERLAHALVEQAETG
ncbi:MAG TPA: poly-gamma-glutamate system protein [Clostridia bacterium]|nr:poly-gamma-glutamate system protein [Clostridia bacterium]